MRKALTLALLPLGLIAPLGAQQSVLPYLPADTVLAVTVPDLDASAEEFARMPLARIWREEEVQNFVRDAMEMAREQIDRAVAQAKEMHAQGKLPVDPEKLLALRLRGGTLAVTKLDLQVGDFGPIPEIGIMLHLDLGETAQQWSGLVKMGLDMLAQQAGEEIEREEFQVGEAKVVCLRPTAGPPGLRMGLNVATVGNGILIGTLTDEIRATLEAMAAQEAVLGASERYLATARHLAAEGAEARMYMRLDSIVDFGIAALGIAAQMEPELAWLDVEGVRRAVDALGLRGIHSLGAASSYQDGRAVSTSYVVAPAPDRKGLLAGADKNLDLAFLRWVPSDAVSFTATTMEPMSIYDAAVAALKAYDAEKAGQLLTKLTGLEEQIGFSIREDLFGAVGDTLITWSMPMATMMAPPETAILLKVKDQDKIVKVLRSLTGLSQGMVELEESERRGVKSYQFSFNFDPTGGMGGMNPLDMINPSFAFNEGYMVAGFNASDIRRVFKRMERLEDAPASGDIRGNKEFAAYEGQYPADIQALSFTDWKANLESYYQILTSMLAFVPMNEDIPFDMSLLPDSSTLTKHMFGSIAYTETDGTGIRSTTISPFGPELGIGIAALVAGGVAAFLVLRPRGW